MLIKKDGQKWHFYKQLHVVSLHQTEQSKNMWMISGNLTK